MRFGHFDDQNKEYVITTPQTPLPWINYLGSEDFFSLVSNTAGGYSFYRDARLRRLTRYRYNSSPLDMDGHHIYIKDGDTVWNPGWQPTKTELDSYTCRHGLGYTILEGRKNGVTAQQELFVPKGDACELDRLTLRNDSGTEKELDVFSYVEFCLWDAVDDSSNFQRNFSTGEVEVEGSAVYHKTEYRERRDHYAVFWANCPISSFDTSRDAFCGVYGGPADPQAVRAGHCSGSIYPMGPYQKYLMDKDPELMRTLEKDYRSYMRQKPRYYAQPSVLPDEVFLDTFIGEKSLEWLNEHDNTGAPWHLTVSFAGPHNPWDPPKEDYDAVGDTLWPDPIPNDMEGKPAWIRRRAAQQTGGMTQADLQQVKRCYAGSVRVIDRWIGKLLDWLETSGHKDDTIVIFCADHGELLGDHGLLEKSCMYEGCLRIPLLVHLPGMTQRRDSDALAELMDLAPTCLELAGADWNRREMDAVSLVPVLNGSTEPLRPVQRSELHNCTMLFDGRYKWIRSYNDTDELYDLETDPQELHNVINEHPEVLNRMRPYSFRH